MSALDKSVNVTFLSRWSRRKVAAKNEPQVTNATDMSTQPVTLPVAPAGRHADRNTGANSSTDAPAGMKTPETPRPEPTSPAGDRASELPSIETLTHEADFSPFMGKEVDPGLRNQAMKKLFKDPHYQFGQMDKLDIYIDDYSRPDPIPLEMLRQMNQAKSLFLFEDEEKDSPPLTDPSIGRETDATPLTSGDVTSPEEDSPSEESVQRVETNERPIVDAEIDLQQDKLMVAVTGGRKPASEIPVEGESK